MRLPAARRRAPSLTSWPSRRRPSPARPLRSRARPGAAGGRRPWSNECSAPWKCSAGTDLPAPSSLPSPSSPFSTFLVGRCGASGPALNFGRLADARLRGEPAPVFAIDGELQPAAVEVRLVAQPAHQLAHRDPAPLRDLRRVGRGVALVRADEDVVVLVLDERAVQLRAVEELERLAQLAVEAHLLAQPTPRGVPRRLARARVAAGRVRPEPRRVVLVRRALLHEQAPPPVEDEDREGAVQRARAVH